MNFVTGRRRPLKVKPVAEPSKPAPTTKAEPAKPVTTPKAQPGKSESALKEKDLPPEVFSETKPKP